MKIEHISVSREQCYKTCDQQYKFKYHLNVVSPLPTPFYFVYGKIVHKIIEEYTIAKGKKNIDKIKDAILSGKLEGEKVPPLPAEYRTKLPIHLKNFLKLSQKIGMEGSVEWRFHYDIDPPHKRYCTGFIDRIIQKGDKAFLIDYKTTKAGPWRKNEFNITSDLQLQCYCWVVKREFGLESKNIKAALYYLEDGVLMPVQYGDKTLNSVPEKLLKVYKEIEGANPDMVKGNVGNWCNRCDYRSICPFYRAG